jgi:hypothetical protein
MGPFLMGLRNKIFSLSLGGFVREGVAQRPPGLWDSFGLKN